VCRTSRLAPARSCLGFPRPSIPHRSILPHRRPPRTDSPRPIKPVCDPDLGDRLIEGRRGEVARRGQYEIAAEVVRNPLLGGILMPRLHPFIAVIDTPQICRHTFSEVTEDDLKARVLVEQP